MTPERDIERLLDAWLAEGPEQVSDRAFDDAVARLDRARQRPVWRLPRRDFNVSMRMRLAAAAVAAIAVVALAAQFLPRIPGVGGPTATPSTAPTSSPSATLRPTATPCPTTEPTCTGVLAPGRHMTGKIATPFTFVVPERWSKPLDVVSAVNLVHDDYTDLEALIGIWPDWSIASQTTCSRQPEPGLGRTVDDLVGWLTTQPGLIVTEPEAVTVGGLAGQVLDIRKNPDVTGSCPTDFNMFTHDPTFGSDHGWWYISDDARLRMWFLDAGDGHTVNVDIETANPADFDAFAALAQPIVESFDFSP